MFKKNPKTLVVELNDKGLVLCLKDKKQILTCPFPANSVADMEVIDPNAISNTVNQFISGLKAGKAQVVMIISDQLCFETNLSGLPEVERDIREARFVESVPFETVVAKKFQLGNTMTLAVINRAFFEFFRAIFNNNGWEVVAASPAVVAKAFGYKNQLDSKSCALITKKISVLQQNSFFDVEEQMGSRERHFVQKHGNWFALLSLGAVVMALATSLITLRKPTTLASKANIAPPPPAISQESSPTIAPVTAPEEISVRIVNGSENTEAVNKVQNSLRGLGVINIQVDTASVSSQVTQAGFSNKVDGDLKQKVLDVLNKQFSQLITRELTEGESDIYIVTGIELVLDSN